MMKLKDQLESFGHRMRQRLHLDTLGDAIRTMQTAEVDVHPEWVIVYRTAGGFCCIYRGKAFDFAEMLDIQIWSEEMDVQPYYIGF
ncbi:hypothetical protein [Paraburkholderia sp. SOS3]|uniref:hypothetical protein n=1 Tax=Paraburkholderia sp. SOS3 TaxID=1926494 RepID=UPI0012EC16AE|nr:hypothetical protein [Paraburkholderia sp. SOS3]